MKNLMSHVLKTAAALALVLAASYGVGVLNTPKPALAQTPSAVLPYNVDMGEGNAAPGAAGAGTAQCTAGASANCTPLLMTGQSAGTVNSAALLNLDKNGVQCTVSGIVSTAGPSLVFAVQSFDSIANAWVDIVRSASLTAPANATIGSFPGAVAGTTSSNLPTGWSQVSGFSLPRVWRVQAVVTGGTGLTAKINCQLLRNG